MHLGIQKSNLMNRKNSIPDSTLVSNYINGNEFSIADIPVGCDVCNFFRSVLGKSRQSFEI